MPRVVLGLRGRWGGGGGNSTACELPFYTGPPKALAIAGKFKASGLLSLLPGWICEKQV